ncbi:MAG: hypothetical protein JSW46_10725 [Gemmatimonadota bacterium]|nr:MAG: hypothetical protein JSW46_10725 [Gemmatimonadota bacterium]
MTTDAAANKSRDKTRRCRHGYLTLFTAALMACTGSAVGQEAQVDAWEALQYFLGTWKGQESGVAGEGVGERCYALVMERNYIVAANTSTFEPQEANPEGEVHEDWAFFSYDKIRGKVVLREFHSEGFVNRYLLEEWDPQERRFVFESESIENLTEGWRARVTLTVHGENTFSETFELAAPGEEFESLLENQWSRSVNAVLGMK